MKRLNQLFLKPFVSKTSGINKKKVVNAFQIQRELISDPDVVIFDVGAHHGKIANHYCNLFPQSFIHCFEPFFDSFNILQDKFNNNPTVKCNNLALSDHEGSSTLNINKSSATNSLLKTDTESVKYWGKDKLETIEEVEIKTSTVDAYCRNNDIKRIQILKLDVQGLEYKVLTGAKNMLNSQMIDLIYLELIVCQTYQNQHKLQDYLDFFDSFGYSLLDVYNPKRNGFKLLQVDAIFTAN